jgi:hypothetical protein
MIMSYTSKSLFRVLLLTGSLCLLNGCRRGEEASDTRTLEQRPHTQTVQPDDRRDVFRQGRN